MVVPKLPAPITPTLPTGSLEAIAVQTIAVIIEERAVEDEDSSAAALDRRLRVVNRKMHHRPSHDIFGIAVFHGVVETQRALGREMTEPFAELADAAANEIAGKARMVLAFAH